ncbi:MAG: hypothetical protein ACJAWV_002866 [Flammeovirgaceae bacterium]|jgi:hypothetical protein
MNSIAKKFLRTFIIIVMIVIYVRNINSFDDLLEVKNLIGTVFYLIAFYAFYKADVLFYSKNTNK